MGLSTAYQCLLVGYPNDDHGAKNGADQGASHHGFAPWVRMAMFMASRFFKSHYPKDSWSLVKGHGALWWLMVVNEGWWWLIKLDDHYWWLNRYRKDGDSGWHGHFVGSTDITCDGLARNRSLPLISPKIWGGSSKMKSSLTQLDPNWAWTGPQLDPIPELSGCCGPWFRANRGRSGDLPHLRQHAQRALTARVAQRRAVGLTFGKLWWWMTWGGQQGSTTWSKEIAGSEWEWLGIAGEAFVLFWLSIVDNGDWWLMIHNGNGDWWLLIHDGW